MEQADPIEELDEFGESIHAWELGPDGATFTEPVELRFKVSAADLAQGLWVAARSTDGTLEPIDLTIEDDGDSFELIGEISHFTLVEIRRGVVLDIIISAPSEVEVDSEFSYWLSLSTGETEGLQSERNRRRARRAVSTDRVIVVELGPGEAFCLAEGSGFIRYDGPISIRATWLSPEIFRTLPDWRGWSRIRTETTVKCVEKGKEVPPEDEQCTDRNTGDTAEDCTFPESVTVSGNSDGTTTVDISFTDGLDEAEVTLEFVSDNPDELLLVDCTNRHDCTIFYGPGFAELDSPFNIESRSTECGSIQFTGIPLTKSESGELLLEIPAGITSEGVAVDEGLRVITEVIIYTEQAANDSGNRLQGISKYPPTDFAAPEVGNGS